jgi:ABC-type nitrate/sulfonate/bicarbonate transport system ATPase subunit
VTLAEGGRAVATRVEVGALRHRFARGERVTQALDGLDLDVVGGEFVAVVGPSGCGKSTLLRIVAGLLPFTSGTLRVGGRDVVGPQTDLGIVLQSPVLPDWRNPPVRRGGAAAVLSAGRLTW